MSEHLSGRVNVTSWLKRSLGFHCRISATAGLVLAYRQLLVAFRNEVGYRDQRSFQVLSAAVVDRSDDLLLNANDVLRRRFLEVDLDQGHSLSKQVTWSFAVPITD